MDNGDYPILTNPVGLENKVKKILEILKYDSPLWKAKESKLDENIKSSLETIICMVEGMDSSIDSLSGSIEDLKTTIDTLTDKIENIEEVLEK